MQRRNSLTPRPSDSASSDPLDALSKPEDEQLFYTASVHFLRKRLEEKSNRLSKPQDATQSCCNLTRPVVTHRTNVHKISRLELDKCPAKESCLRVEIPSLSMNQVLPFPKSNKEGFFARLKNTFRKTRRPADVTVQNIEESEAKNISNFKFPRCSRLRHPHSSCLLQITEETSNETIRTPNVRVSRHSKGDLLEEKKFVTHSRR